MTYEIAKVFDRNGRRLRPGSPVPDDVDKTTLEHYRRHGMVREAKPAKPARMRSPRPAETKPAEPSRADTLRDGPSPAETKADTPAEPTSLPESMAAETLRDGPSLPQEG